MNQSEKIQELINNDDFCFGLGIDGLSNKEKTSYVTNGFKESDINTFYYEFIDPQ